MSSIFGKEAIIVLILLALPIISALDSQNDMPQIQDSKLSDFDNDGMPDAWELRNGLRYDVSDAQSDNDNDGLTNIEEYGYGSDPNSPDSCGNGIGDYQWFNIKGNTACPKKSGSSWVFIVFPILIILFMLGLLLSHQYNLDIIIKEKFSKYFMKKQPVAATSAMPIRQEKPKISYVNVAQISKEAAEKRKEREKMLWAFGIRQDVQKKQPILQPIRYASAQQLKQIPRQAMPKRIIPGLDKLKSTFGIEEKPSEKKEESKLNAGKSKEEKISEEKLAPLTGLAKTSKPEKKDDIFGKLKEISKDQQQMKKEVFKKLEEVGKKEETKIKVIPVVITKSAPKKIIQVVSTKKSQVYHKTGCITIKGKTGLLTYKEEDEASKKGLKRCHVCFPKTEER